VLRRNTERPVAIRAHEGSVSRQRTRPRATCRCDATPGPSCGSSAFYRFRNNAGAILEPSGSSVGEIRKANRAATRHDPSPQGSTGHRELMGMGRKTADWELAIEEAAESEATRSVRDARDTPIKVLCAPSEAGAHDTLVALSEQKSLPRRELRLWSCRVRRRDLHGKPALRGESRTWQG